MTPLTPLACSSGMRLFALLLALAAAGPADKVYQALTDPALPVGHPGTVPGCEKYEGGRFETALHIDCIQFPVLMEQDNSSTGGNETMMSAEEPVAEPTHEEDVPELLEAVNRIFAASDARARTPSRSPAPSRASSQRVSSPQNRSFHSVATSYTPVRGGVRRIGGADNILYVPDIRTNSQPIVDTTTGQVASGKDEISQNPVRKGAADSA